MPSKRPHYTRGRSRKACCAGFVLWALLLGGGSHGQPAAGQATTPASAMAPQVVAEIEARARQLFEKADRAALWPMYFPSVATHRLLACGRACPSPDTTQSYLAAWFGGHLTRDTLRTLHRNELLAVAAELSLPLDTRIAFAPADTATLGSLLQEARQDFGLPPRSFWNRREARKGIEYGWSLRAFCAYLGPTAAINDAVRVDETIAHILAQGLNETTEAGTHELEGLAYCLNRYNTPLSADTTSATIYAEAAAFLEQRLLLDLGARTDAGLVYDQRSGFSRCITADKACRLLSALVKQAHFFEWAAWMPGIASRTGLDAALTQWAQLLYEVGPLITTEWLQQSTIHQGLVLAAMSHSIHAAEKLMRSRNASSPVIPQHRPLSIYR